MKILKKTAKQFVHEWENRGDEKQDTSSFWMDLLQSVFGIQNIVNVIKFEVKTSKKRGGKDFKDAVLYRYTDNEVLIEQKSADIPLDRKIRQSNGELLTPFEQAKNYDNNSSVNDKARWIITCNFKEFWIYDMFKEGKELYEPVKLKLEELPSHLDWLSMLESPEPEKEPDFKEETEVSVKAGELVGILYDALAKQYNHQDDEQQKALNKLCVRIVFCLYAEDSGLFKPKQFHDYMESYKTGRMRQALTELFQVLNTKIEDRKNYYFEEEQLAFPYTNGGLFEGEIEIPMFTEEIRTILLDKESSDFDWSSISPTIFGAVFESTLNPETRRAGGMHYTSLLNIHKVIDPLFLNDLRKELNLLLSSEATTENQYKAYQDKLASLSFLDPACGSGNFLTETYISLRKLENEALKKINRGQQQLGAVINPIKVSIQQMYGIEVNDFAVSVAQTALWIAEHKMFKATEEILDMHLDFLPLKTFNHIYEGNALRIDWNSIVSARKLNYIMGNPPFVGHQNRSSAQHDDMDIVFCDLDKHGKLDYVCAWYAKAAQYIQNFDVQCAFVSTNSICQGESTPILWNYLLQKRITINFAYRSFVWNNEATSKVHTPAKLSHSIRI
jgi:type I restriction-modification system DNA methylase subunit